MAGTNKVVITFSIVMFLLLILLLGITYNSKCQMENVEKFYTDSVAERDIMHNNMDKISSGISDKVSASDPLGNETFKPVESFAEKSGEDVLQTQLQGVCASRDKLTASDLLPLDANSKWAELNPQCAGDIQDQNYLTAGYHIGVNTVGQSLRNANLQLRYEPPNPQIPVSPWQISTIEPEHRIQGLMDIGSPPTH